MCVIVEQNSKTDNGGDETVVEEYGLVGAFALSKWLTSNRLYCAWELVKQTKGSYTAWEFARDIGCSPRTLYRWLGEESVPSPVFLERLEKLFKDVLGRNWMKRIETLQEVIQNSNLLKERR